MMPSEKNTKRVILALDQAYEKFIQLEDASTDEAEIVAYRCYYTNIHESKLYVEQMQKEIDRLKAEQPKKGRWVGINEYVYHLEQETGERYCVSAYYDGDLFCDQCWTSHRKTKYNFCPNCGADMREKVINSPGIIKAMQEKAQKDGEQE